MGLGELFFVPCAVVVFVPKDLEGCCRNDEGIERNVLQMGPLGHSHGQPGKGLMETGLVVVPVCPCVDHAMRFDEYAGMGSSSHKR